MEQFVVGVRLDPHITTANHLDKIEVANHLVEVLTEFSTQLLATQLTPLPEKLKEGARLHGRIRWGQGYRFNEVLREYSVLRRVLLFQLAAFESAHLPFMSDPEGRASRTLHALLDEVMLCCADEFSSLLPRKGI